jgi:1-aminocyclopropane-1-carboxylate deaminase/D-cysteine desulfhydrase-like pyridoxal-dependent ACC family enzyme
VPTISATNELARTLKANALEAAFPALRNSLRRIALADLPTTLEPAAKLAAEIGLDNLRIKRDDQTGLVYGGNKVRKLEYLFGDALHRNCDSVITFGAVGSNHALATAIYATRLGLNCHVVMTEQTATPYVDRTLRYHAVLGTRLELAQGYTQLIEIADRMAADHPTGTDRLYRIPWGGSSPLGTIGFVNAALELSAQCDDRGDDKDGDKAPDVIYIACGTMGTVAGLALGLRLAGLKTRVEAIRVVPESVMMLSGIEKLFMEANRELQSCDPSIPIFTDPLMNVAVRNEFFGAGYAEVTPECLEAVALIHDIENVSLETTYTGKALAALIHDARNEQLSGQSVVFWNTYNSRPYPPAVNDETGLSLPDWAQRYLSNHDHH